MPSDTRPPGPRTGLANPGCYAHALADCVAEIDNEHPMSEVVLESLPQHTVEGYSWLDEPKAIPPARLKSHVLCKRHNRALSPVDAEAGRFFKQLMQLRRREAEWAVVCGEDLERWALKLMLGTIVSGHARLADKGPRVDADAADIPEHYLRYLFGETPLAPACGLHLMGEHPPEAEGADLSWLPLFYPEEVTSTWRHFGITVKLLMLPFVMSMDPDFARWAAVIEPPGIQLVLRPGIVRYKRGDAVIGQVGLTWEHVPPEGPHLTAVLSIIPTTTKAGL